MTNRITCQSIKDSKLHMPVQEALRTNGSADLQAAQIIRLKVNWQKPPEKAKVYPKII